MNNVFFLKGAFKSHKHPRAMVVPNLPSGSQVSSEHIRRISEQLVEVLEKWKKDPLLGTCLVSVHYNRIIPKTKRITTIFTEGGDKPGDCIRGAKFEDTDFAEGETEFHKRHVFTYEVSIAAIEKSIELLVQSVNIVDHYYYGSISDEDISRINKGQYSFDGISKSAFVGLIVDCNVIHHIEIDEYSQNIPDGSLISLFKVNKPLKTVFHEIGIDITDGRMLDECTVRLFRKEIDQLQSRAPYLIAMLNDFSKYDISPQEQGIVDNPVIQIPSPTDEPVIGVIDTHFDKRVYFQEWVDYHNEMVDAIELDSDDYFHGTAVSSIIVDGPTIDPRLEDGCGRFRVKHFGVAKEKGTGSFEILKKIKEIVKRHSEIKVWNLSLGSLLETSENSISAEAAILDQIQSENDIIFVIAGTNDWGKTGNKRLGAPADSINSLVVNSTSWNGGIVSYARKGPVLGFFYKPDVSAYGGDTGDYMRVCGPLGEARVSGTSFAAPWVARKVAFLIYKMGLNREVAKALLIDAAAGWDRKDGTECMTGYGVVPIHIKDILETREDEIRFVITGTIEEYETYNYTIPVPIQNGMQPFWARATLVYFPYCDRNQGVDYTSTEVDLHFGRVYKEKDRVKIKEINDNKQANEGIEKIYEKDARLIYRKWDNVKYISEKPKKVARPKKTYEAGMWGLRIVTKERGDAKRGKGMQFGTVITLKEMNGINRIDEFIKLCGLYGWLVNPIDINASLELYAKTDDTITWD